MDVQINKPEAALRLVTRFREIIPKL